MSEFTATLAETALRFSTGPATISPLLDENCGKEIKHTVLSSESVKFQVILNVAGLKMDEVKVEHEKKELRIEMQHATADANRDGVQWSRNCTYRYTVPDDINCLTALWTHDCYLIIQSRNSQTLDKVEDKTCKLFPQRLTNVLRPGMQVSNLRGRMELIEKKAKDVLYYVKKCTDVAEDKDVLSLLQSMPLVRDKPAPDYQEALEEFIRRGKGVAGKKQKTKTSSVEESADEASGTGEKSKQDPSGSRPSLRSRQPKSKS